MASVKVDLTAYLPTDKLRAFLQHVRDFDVANPGCHFQFLSMDTGGDMTVDEVNALLDSIEPAFDLRATIRKPPVD